MGLRCDQCNKFAAYDTDGEPELLSEEVSLDGRVQASVRITNDCADCGQELTEANFDIEIDLSEQVADHYKKNKKCAKAAELELEVTPTRINRTQDKDRNGRPIKSFRFRRRYYGVEVEVTVTCATCGEIFTGTGSDEIQANGMDSLV